MVLMAVAFVSLYLNPEIYQKTTNIQHINQWSDVEVFVSKGGPYPFLYSFRDQRLGAGRQLERGRTAGES